MDNEEEQVDASNQQQEAVLEPANEDVELSIEDVKAKLEEAEQARLKAEEIADNQRIRAERAEKAAKAEKPEAKKPAPKAGEITTKDVYVLMEAKVPQEDIDDVSEYAKLKNISIADALKSNVVKTILADKQEQRNVAAATNIGTVRRGNPNQTSEAILASASKGQLPEDPSGLVQARLERKKKK